MIFCKCGNGASKRGPDGSYWCMGCFEAKAWECREVGRADRLTAAREAVVEAAKEWEHPLKHGTTFGASTIKLGSAVRRLLEVESEHG